VVGYEPGESSFAVPHRWHNRLNFKHAIPRHTMGECVMYPPPLPCASIPCGEREGVLPHALPVLGSLQASNQPSGEGRKGDWSLYPNVVLVPFCFFWPHRRPQINYFPRRNPTFRSPLRGRRFCRRPRRRQCRGVTPSPRSQEIEAFALFRISPSET